MFVVFKEESAILGEEFVIIEEEFAIPEEVVDYLAGFESLDDVTRVWIESLDDVTRALSSGPQDRNVVFPAY